MKKEIPHLQFKAPDASNFGFEIVSIEHIAQLKGQQGHEPEKPHQLKFYNLIYITEGSGQHFIDFHWYPIQKHNLIYLGKDQVNAFDFSSDIKGYCMIFTEEYLIDCFSNVKEHLVFRLFYPQLFSSILQLPPNADFHSYFELLHKEFLKPQSFNAKSIIDALFVILVSKAENIKLKATHHITNTRNIDYFQRFTKLLEQHIHQSRSAKFYALALAISYKHLNTLCKELVGKTAKMVIDEYLILQAKRKLINTTMKSNELAYSLGFEDPTNFTKFFKKHTGFTPKSFIKSLHND